MKIITRFEFLARPPGTVFAKYAPCHFEGICIKGVTLQTNDFYYQSLVDALDVRNSEVWSGALFKSEETGSSIPMDFNVENRDGLFENDQLFAIFERIDLIKLQHRLDQALKAGYPK